MSRVVRHAAAYLAAATIGALAALAALAFLGWFVNTIVEDATDMPRAAP